eukprot:5731300-Pyramimonas_sp.AAC.1
MSVVHDATSDFPKPCQSCEMQMELQTKKLHVGRVRCPMELQTSKLHVSRVRCPCTFKLQNFMPVV